MEPKVFLMFFSSIAQFVCTIHSSALPWQGIQTIFRLYHSEKSGRNQKVDKMQQTATKEKGI
jgi:hypothetical protein